MIARTSSIPSLPISLLALVIGFVLSITGSVPLAVIGAGLILFSFLLPFLRLGIKPNPLVASPVRPAETEAEEGASPIAVARSEEDLREALARARQLSAELAQMLEPTKSAERQAAEPVASAGRPAAEATTATIAFPNLDEARQAVQDIQSIPLERREITVDHVEASSNAGGGLHIVFRIVLRGEREGMTRGMIEERYHQIRASSGAYGRFLVREG